MSDSDEQDGNDTKAEGTIKAITGLVKAVPVYEDALKPVAQETGKALGTVGRAVNAALLPMRGIVWGVEQIEEFVQARVARKLESVPPENIQSPDLSVAGPALESLRYTGHKDSLSDMYANLLASSMDRETASTAHPGFVEIIRNMASDEARLIRYVFEKGMVPVVDIKRRRKDPSGEQLVKEVVGTYAYHAGCDHQDLGAAYMVNLERLGLVALRRGAHLTAEGVYDEITEAPDVARLIDLIDQEEGHTAAVDKFHVAITPFGQQFGRACVAPKFGRPT